MSSKLAPYPLPPLPRSSLLKDVPTAIPSTEELDQLHAELKLRKQKTLERAKKAGEDLKTIEESMRRMKEKEKGKSKAIDKVKREREFTPSLDTDDSRNSAIHVHPSKPRTSSHPVHALPTSSSRSSLDPRRSAADELRKKKKKRKRENGDSDGEHDAQRPRKTTPPSASHSISHPPKTHKPTVPTVTPHPKSTAGPDFTVPQPQPLLPQRPPIPPPPVPGPSKPIEVIEDFSKSKQPAQTLVSTFYTSIEPYIRPIREEDVGFLEYTGDEVEPYVMPKLGRHYLEVWEDQDLGLLPPPALAEPQIAPPSTFAAPAPKWDPSTLAEVDLVGEERGHGPLTERVISALLPVPDLAGWKGVKAAEDAMEGRPGGSGAAAARRERLNVTDLETRIRDTMRFHGLLNEMPDYTEKVDDPIATALRQAQRELRTVVATNKARKERLASIARDRLGYQEYLELRDSIDKNITTLYGKLQKKDTPKLNKKKKKPVPGPNAEGEAGPSMPPVPAAIGLNTDEENHLFVNDQLRMLVETRRQWVDTVGPIFEEKQEESPGRIWGLPKESVYQGVDEEVVEMLRAGVNGNGNMNGNRNGDADLVTLHTNDYNMASGSGKGKGKDRPRGDEMDVG
ncbi:histone acetyltransferases subunit 3-domain-containing protein [Crucibulum laeve]|uniref:Histone acetyltransferases subunit 3-domain-containing protein n=1 Tax=Crucibulum laeve TaxID=68775 RepID=A0A5C3LIE6_9AGAR|nr:histone acetyltransferases subunit 3-domain-containing protein [Crucibulum laeve]